MAPWPGDPGRPHVGGPRAAGMAGGKSIKRRLETETGGTLHARSWPEDVLIEKHPFLHQDDAKAMKYELPKSRLRCSYKFCKKAQEMPRQIS